jgi:hypothetical protein
MNSVRKFIASGREQAGFSSVVYARRASLSCHEPKRQDSVPRVTCKQDVLVFPAFCKGGGILGPLLCVVRFASCHKPKRNRLEY